MRWVVSEMRPRMAVALCTSVPAVGYSSYTDPGLKRHGGFTIRLGQAWRTLFKRKFRILTPGCHPAGTGYQRFGISVTRTTRSGTRRIGAYPDHKPGPVELEGILTGCLIAGGKRHLLAGAGAPRRWPNGRIRNKHKGTMPVKRHTLCLTAV
eukprot:3185781-Rhodomonas_salina.4